MKKQKKKKEKKKLSQQISQCKLLASYIDNDYEGVRKRLYPLLKAGNITFDLIWALFKPKTIAYTTTYGNEDDPMCFRVEYATKQKNWMGEEWWSIDGASLEYDGENFGLSDTWVKIDRFRGTRKITGLNAYPLSYHKDPAGLRKDLIERGKKFVALQGMNYRHYAGLAVSIESYKRINHFNLNASINNTREAS
jgi:hypothetical protein